MNRPRIHNKDLPRCVYFRHNAFYFVRNGKWTRLGKTRKEAIVRYASLYEAKEGTMAGLIAEALPHILRDVKPNTKAQYEIGARKLAKMFAEFHPEEVTQAEVKRMMQKMAATPNMANRCLSLLRNVFDYALGIHVTTNPCIGIKRHKEVKRVRLLSLAEVSAIREASVPRLRAIIDLLLLTGQRIGDVLAIRRADLLEDGIQFRQQKTGAKVLVAWNTELRAAVERAKKLSKKTAALTLFHNRRGKTPDYRTVKHQWDTARDKAGVQDATLHDLRAVAATWTAKDGGDATALLGHTSASQTVRYLRDKETRVAEGPSFGLSNGLLDRKR